MMVVKSYHVTEHECLVKIRSSNMRYPLFVTLAKPPGAQ